MRITRVRSRSTTTREALARQERCEDTKCSRNIPCRDVGVVDRVWKSRPGKEDARDRPSARGLFQQSVLELIRQLPNVGSRQIVPDVGIRIAIVLPQVIRVQLESWLEEIVGRVWQPRNVIQSMAPGIVELSAEAVPGSPRERCNQARVVRDPVR